MNNDDLLNELNKIEKTEGRSLLYLLGAACIGALILTAIYFTS